MDTVTVVCRLCGAPASLVFRHTVLLKYDAGYFECGSCGCVQTEAPWWLDEAYAIEGVHIDVGQAARVVQTWIRVSRLLQMIDWPKSARCLDFGASTGLLARLMRDAGYDFRPFDAYDRACRYANYFRVDDIAGWAPELITAFEVFEHFANPGEDLRALLASRPRLLVFTTQFWEGQGADWEYLVPFCGQHVFFYTERGLRAFAERLGYRLHRGEFLSFLTLPGDALGERVVQAAAQPVLPEWAGHFVMEVGWGSEKTAEDGLTARARFVADLAGSKGEAGPADGTASL